MRFFVRSVDGRSGDGRGRSGFVAGERLDFAPGVFSQMVGEIVQRPGRSQLLTDLGDRRVLGVAARSAVAGQRSVTRIEVNHHVAMVFVFPDFETELPAMSN